MLNHRCFTVVLPNLIQHRESVLPRINLGGFIRRNAPRWRMSPLTFVTDPRQRIQLMEFFSLREANTRGTINLPVLAWEACLFSAMKSQVGI
jgi:hypothetical protein